MLVSDILSTTLAKVGLAQTDAVPTVLHDLALKFLNRVYEDVWNQYPFRDQKLVSITVSVAADTEELILPYDLDAVRSVRTATDPLYPINEIFMSDVWPEAFSEEGTEPAHWFSLPDSPVYTQPAAAGAVTVVSASSTDTSLVVRVWGVSSGVQAYESLTLNGTTPVVGSTSFSEILGISKPLTTGRVTVTMGGSTAGTLAPWDYAGAYRRVRLCPIPTAATTLYIEGTRRFPRLTDDGDAIVLKKCESGIIDLLEAELLEYAGRPQEAVASRQKAEARLTTALRHETLIERADNRSYPEWGMFGDDTELLDSTRKTI